MSQADKSSDDSISYTTSDLNVLSDSSITEAINVDRVQIENCLLDNVNESNDSGDDSDFNVSNEALSLDLSENTSSSDQETLATPICFDFLKNSESDCETADHENSERENLDRFTEGEAGNVVVCKHLCVHTNRNNVNFLLIH